MNEPQIPSLSQSEAQPSAESTFKTVILLATIGLLMIVGLGLVLPRTIMVVNDATQQPQDNLRKKLSSDYIAADIIKGQPIPSETIEQPQPIVKFSILEYPIFQRYGYNWSFMFEQKGFSDVKSTPNASSSLFIIETAGKNWNKPIEGYAVSSLLVFNKDISFFKVMPLPKKSDACCNATAAWLGNRYILVNQFIPGVYPPGAGNYFFIGDSASSTANVTFEPIPVPESLKDKHHLGIKMFSHPYKNLAALSYCLTTVQLVDRSYCSQSGVSIATPNRIIELINKNTENNLKTSWDDNNLYIQELDRENKVIETYTLPLSTYENDQFVSTLDQYREPGIQGKPAWIRVDVPITQKFNSITFDVDFSSTSTYAQYSRGFLTIKLNDEPIGHVYEEQEPTGPHKKIFYFKPPPIGTSTLEFRIDPLNPRVSSTILEKNVSLNYSTSTGPQ